MQIQDGRLPKINLKNMIFMAIYSIIIFSWKR